MGVIVPHFGPTVELINATFSGTTESSDVISLGHEDPTEKQAFAGCVLDILISQIIADSAIDVSILGSYDGVTVDTEPFIYNDVNDTVAPTTALLHAGGPSFRIPFGVDAGKSGNQRRSVVFEAHRMPPAFRVDLDRATGTAVTTAIVNMRRFWWQQVQG